MSKRLEEIVEIMIAASIAEDADDERMKSEIANDLLYGHENHVDWLIEQNKRYREALEFYAKENNHVFWEDIREGENFVQLPISETDKGYIARKALEESK